MIHVTILVMPPSLFLLEDPSILDIAFYLKTFLIEMQPDCHIIVFGIAVKLSLKCGDEERGWKSKKERNLEI